MLVLDKWFHSIDVDCGAVLQHSTHSFRMQLGIRTVQRRSSRNQPHADLQLVQHSPSTEVLRFLLRFLLRCMLCACSLVPHRCFHPLSFFLLLPDACMRNQPPAAHAHASLAPYCLAPHCTAPYCTAPSCTAPYRRHAQHRPGLQAGQEHQDRDALFRG